MDTIYFYDVPSDRVKEENVFLNNFYISPIVVDNKEFPTVEHYYQASKFKGQELFESVRLTPTPDDAKKLARANFVEDEEWKTEKEMAMRTALQAKFSQHRELREKLIATGEARLVEDSPKDAFWGGIVEGSFNRPGDMLMEIREDLKSN